jgi:hypothetical protein
MISRLYPLEDGRMACLSSASIREPSGASERWYVGLVLNAEGDTLVSVESAHYRQGRIEFDSESRIGMSMTPVFYTRSMMRYFPGRGFLCYATGDPTLSWFNLDGELTGMVRLDVEPDPVTAADRDGYIRMLDKQISEAEEGMNRAASELRRKHLSFEDNKPLFSTVDVDEYGYYWLTEVTDFQREDPYAGGYTVRLLSPEGEYLGKTEYPERMARPCRGYLMTSREDEETGELFLTVFRMVPAVEGFKFP